MLIGAPAVFANVRVGTMILELPLQPHYRPRPHGHRSTGAIAMFEAEQAHGLSVEGESDGKSPSYTRGLVFQSSPGALEGRNPKLKGGAFQHP